ncbi:MFS transporter [Prauserella muralis]|uniref:MFS transporter n=1 Tax=Prauserella muralis TaxID=588067 RepID=A0A2V4B1M6_9PSEU|nr:MFS transporter [Prauserella muralis]PXY27045.1 MFS transporter [Prauserella muralis]TWE23328.1 putative MFS family arabinose efflux permease [Prauserella muralis]
MAGGSEAPAPSRTLALTQFADSVGLGGYLVCVVVYFTTIVGLSPAGLGAGLALGWGAGMLAGTPLGRLADRWGARRVAIVCAAVAGVAVAAFGLARSMLGFLLVAALFATAHSGLAAARQALLAGLAAPAERTAIRARLQSAGNAGLALGSALGGLALYAGERAAYVAAFGLAAVSFGVAAVLLRRVPAVAPVRGGRAPAAAVLRDRPYAVLAVLNLILLLHLPMLSIGVPLWIVLRTQAPDWMVSVLLVVNMLAVSLFQVRVARRVRDLPAAARSVRLAGVLLLAACVVYAVSGAGTAGWVAACVLVAAAVLQVVGEMLHSSGSWEIGFGLAPDDAMGQYQGFFGSGMAAARMLGPVVVTTALAAWGVFGWLALGSLFLGAALATGPALRWAVARRRARTCGGCADAPAANRATCF